MAIFYPNPKKDNKNKIAKAAKGESKKFNAKWAADLSKAGIAKKDRQVLTPEELESGTELNGKQK